MGKRSRQPSAIDLFAGAGGATQGLTDAGYRVLAAIEIDRTAADSYAMNHPAVRLERANIRDVDAGRWRRQLGIRRGALSLIQACPPCPSWSTLGAKTPDDDRRTLISEVLRFIIAFEPRSFVVENVPGLARDQRLADLIADVSGMGYGVRTYVVDAMDFAVPQRRRRLIVLGVRGRETSSLPVDLLAAVPISFDRKPTLAGSVFDFTARLDVAADELHVGRSHGASVIRRLAAIPVGGTRFDLPEELTLLCHRALGKRNATAAYGRIDSSGVAPTLTTRCTTPACGAFVHPIENRGITLREAALLQTFPPTYRFAGDYGSKERQIGNAIPVRLAEAIGVAAYRLATKRDGQGQVNRDA